MTDKNADKRVLTPEFRVSFPSVFKPYSYEGQPAKFVITMLFNKKVDITALKKAAFAAATEKFGPKEKWPKNLMLPFSDGDEKSDLDGYPGNIIVKASSKNRPGVVDSKKQPITEEDGTFFAGCYARATLSAFSWSKMGKNGVSFGLQNIQKIRDGEPFGSRRSADADFDEIEDSNFDGGGKEAESDELELGF